MTPKQIQNYFQILDQLSQKKPSDPKEKPVFTRKKNPVSPREKKYVDVPKKKPSSSVHRSRPYRMYTALTHKYIKECVDYDASLGELTWKFRPREHFATLSAWSRWNTLHIGKIAGTVNKYTGRKTLLISGKAYYYHRVVWLWVYGEWPKGYIDHINGNPLDNRITNLREATFAQNCWNSKIPKTNTSGVKGVFKTRKGWQVTIGKTYVGSFTLKSDAEKAARAARISLHGEFANHGENQEVYFE